MFVIAWLTLLLLAALVIIAVGAWLRRTGELVAPLPICLGTIAFYVVIRAAYLLWFERAPLTSAGLPLEEQVFLITKTIGITIVGVLAFLIGHHSSSAAFAGTNLRFSLPRPDRSRAMVLGTVLWVTGFAAAAYLVVELGGVTSAFAHQHEIGVVLANRELFFELTRLLIVPTALLLTDPRGHGSRWWVWLLAAVTTVVVLPLGRRAIIALAACYPLALYHLTVRRISARASITMLTVGAVALFSFSYIRLLGPRTLGKAVRVFASDPSLAVHFGFASNGELMIFDATTIVVRDVPSEMPFNYGSTIARVPVWAIPRAIWSDKPVTLGREIVTRYLPSSGAAYPPMAIGDLYAAAGVFAVILGFACFGWVSRAAWEWHLRHTGPGNASVYLAFCFFVFDYSRVGDPSRTVWFFVVALASMTMAFTLAAQPRDRSFSAVPEV